MLDRNLKNYNVLFFQVILKKRVLRQPEMSLLKNRSISWLEMSRLLLLKGKNFPWLSTNISCWKALVSLNVCPSWFIITLKLESLPSARIINITVCVYTEPSMKGKNIFCRINFLVCGIHYTGYFWERKTKGGLWCKTNYCIVFVAYKPMISAGLAFYPLSVSGKTVNALGGEVQPPLPYPKCTLLKNDMKITVCCDFLYFLLVKLVH